MNEMKETETTTEGGTVLGPATAICGSAKNIPTLYACRLCVHAKQSHTHPDTHTQILYTYKYPVVAKWQHYRTKASGNLRVQTQHQLLRVVCIPSTWGSSSRRTPSIYIHSSETKNLKLSVMRLTSLLCSCRRCTVCSFR